MYRVTLDSNIYVSALNFGGVPIRVLGMARAGIVQIDISPAILSETFGVLRDKFNWPGYRLHDAREKLMRMTRLVEPTLRLEGITDDPDDHRIVECAVTAGSDHRQGRGGVEPHSGSDRPERRKQGGESRHCPEPLG